MNIEERFRILREYLRKIDKIPPSEYCLKINGMFPDYHENLLSEKQREKVKSHLVKCLWCFKSYMDYSITMAQARAGTLPPAPKWLRDMGIRVLSFFAFLDHPETITIKGAKNISKLNDRFFDKLSKKEREQFFKNISKVKDEKIKKILEQVRDRIKPKGSGRSRSVGDGVAHYYLDFQKPLTSFACKSLIKSLGYPGEGGGPCGPQNKFGRRGLVGIC